MDRHSSRLMIFVVSGLLLFFRPTVGLRFAVDKEECLTHAAEYEGDTVHASFVAINYEGQDYSDDGLDLVVRDPDGAQIYDVRNKISEKFEFVVGKKGHYSFCFTNKSPYPENIDFDVQLNHFSHIGQHAKDEHVDPLLEQIAKLQEALGSVKFEQHWYFAFAFRQIQVNEHMSRWAIHKAIFESAALVGASMLQVYLLRRLFERKLGTSRV